MHKTNLQLDNYKVDLHILPPSLRNRPLPATQKLPIATLWIMIAFFPLVITNTLTFYDTHFLFFLMHLSSVMSC